MNNLIDYEWKYEIGKKWNDREGGLVTAKVSDWDAAEECTVCGRKIVHVFWVENEETGRIEPYGREHLHVALGYKKELSDRKINSIKTEAEIKKRNREIRREELIIREKDYFFDSVRHLKKINNSPLVDSIGYTTFYNHQTEKFITILDGNSEDTNILYSLGYATIDPNTARKINKFKPEEI